LRIYAGVLSYDAREPKKIPKVLEEASYYGAFTAKTLQKLFFLFHSIKVLFKFHFNDLKYLNSYIVDFPCIKMPCTQNYYSLIKNYQFII